MEGFAHVLRSPCWVWVDQRMLVGGVGGDHGPRQGLVAWGGAELTPAWVVRSDKLWPPCVCADVLPAPTPTNVHSPGHQDAGLAPALMADQSLETATPGAVAETTMCRGWQALPERVPLLVL